MIPTSSIIKGCVTKTIIDCISIKNYTLYLLHIEIGVGNNIVKSYYDCINKIIELITDEVMLWINNKSLLMNENVKLIKDWESWINNNNDSRLVHIRVERKIITFWKEKLDNNKLLLTGVNKISYINSKDKLSFEINELMNWWIWRRQFFCDENSKNFNIINININIYIYIYIYIHIYIYMYLLRVKMYSILTLLFTTFYVLSVFGL